MDVNGGGRRISSSGGNPERNQGGNPDDNAKRKGGMMPKWKIGVAVAAGLVCMLVGGLSCSGPIPHFLG